MSIDLPNEYLKLQVKKLSEKFSPDIIFIEIGTATGNSAKWILNGINESEIKRWFFTVDPYGDKPYKTSAGISNNMDYGEKSYRRAMLELNKYTYENELLYCHWRMLDSDFMKIFPEIEFWHKGGKIKNPQFGFIFLDGEHIPDVILKEFEWFYERMPSGGMIAIDDINYLDMEEGTKSLLKGFKGKFEFQTDGSNHRAYFTKL